MFENNYRNRISDIMKKIELVYREILFNSIEKKRRTLTQKELAEKLNISLSTVNHAMKPLRKMGSVRIKKRSFEVVNVKKILYYWASVRNIDRDIIYFTRIEKSASQIEKSMPQGVEFACYSAYKFKFNDVPADYNEVYIYSNNSEEIKKRFPEKKGPPNLFVLKKDFDKVTIAQIFVDLWNLKEWYAKEFMKSMEERLHGILA